MDNPVLNPKKNPESDTKKTRDASMKTLAVIGLIALLGLVSVGIIRIAPDVVRSIASAAVSFSSIFVPAPKLAVTASKTTVNSGEPFTLSWTQANTDLGSYTISYPCVNNSHLADVTAGKNTVIFCNSIYQFLNEGNSITLAGYLDAGNTNQSIDIPVSVRFTKNGASSQTSEGTVTITISNSGNTSIQPTPSPTNITIVPSPSPSATPHPTYQTPGQATQSVYVMPGQQTSVTANPYVNPDLTAHILATGIIDPVTNVFTVKDKVLPSNRAAIQFEIVNQGGRPSGTWSFAVVLPTFPAFTFMSESQPSLNPGDKIQYTIGFDQIKQQTKNDFIINVDNRSEVNETNKTNNIVQGSIFE